MRGRSRIVFLVGLVLGLIAFVTAVPILVPVEKVRSGVERLIGSYAGEAVDMRGPGAVRLFPGLEVEFRDVETRARADGKPVLSAERVRLSFDLVQYALGRGVIASVEMVKPVIRVPQPDDPLGPVTERDRLARMRPASVTVRGGTVIFVDEAGAALSRLDNLNLDYAWPRPSARARIGATFVWRDQPVSLSLQGHGPRALADGESGNLSLTLTTPSARAAFAGRATVVDRLQLVGTVSLSAARPMALLRWLTGQAPGGFDVANAALDGRLRLSAGSAMVAGAELKLGAAKAEGVLSAEWLGARPLVRGTMDFDALAVERSIASVLPALVPWAATPARLRAADLDLRLSAERLRAETLEARQVAATLVVKDGQLSGQIAEARVAGGDVSARLTTQPRGDTARLVLDVSADRVEAGTLADVLGLAGPRDGVVSGEARVEATAAPAPTVVTDLSGQARLTAERLRFAQTPAWLTAGATATDDALVFDTATIEATLGGGAVQVTRLVADGPAGGLTLAGSIDILRGGLGLSGVRSLPAPAAGSATRALSGLRLGGTIAAPLARP